MSYWHPMDHVKDELAKHGTVSVAGVIIAYWTGTKVVTVATDALNVDIAERQRKHGWTATAEPPKLYHDDFTVNVTEKPDADKQ